MVNITRRLAYTLRIVTSLQCCSNKTSWYLISALGAIYGIIIVNDILLRTNTSHTGPKVFWHLISKKREITSLYSALSKTKRY